MIITIVTPSYNQGSFLAETIESVISQEGSFYIDYLIMDGNSEDTSVDVIKRYQGLLDSGTWPVKCLGINYRWSSTRDEGQADAIRKGFLQAKGSVLAWLNSDDYYLPGTFQAITDFFSKNNDISLTYGDSNYCDESGAVIGRYPAEAFNMSRLASFNIIPQPSTFFRKEAYESVGGVDSSLQFAMDLDLSIRISKKFACHYLPQQLSCYRLHRAAKTMKEDGLFKNHEEALQVALKHFAWAPFNLVYGSCASYCSQKFSADMDHYRLLPIIVSLLCTLFRSLWLNRGIDRRDLQLMNRENFRKLFKSRREILLG